MALVTGNTFSLSLLNPTDAKQGIQLFRQGSATSSAFFLNERRQGVVVSGDLNKFYDVTTGLTTTDTQFKLFQNLIEISDSGNLPAGTSLIEIAARLNLAWSPKPQGGKVTLFVDTEGQLVVQTLGVVRTGAVSFLGIEAVISGVPTNFSALLNLSVPSPIYGSALSEVLIEQDTYSYPELLATQTGSPMTIIAMDIDMLGGNEAQVMNPITHEHLDANGNARKRTALGVIDPYQFQTRHLLDIPTSGLLLDGNTQLDYEVNAFTGVKLTFRYVNAAESMLFGLAIQQQIVEQYRQQARDIIEDSKGLQRVLKIPESTKEHRP